MKQLLKENNLIQKMGWEEFEYEFNNATRVVFQERWEALKAEGLGTLLDQLPGMEKKMLEELSKSADCGAWKTVVEAHGGSQRNRTVSPLQHGTVVKFRVFALNQNGESNPPAESEFQKVCVKPAKPARPEVSHRNETMRWEGPTVPDVTMYRVEGLARDGEWKVLEKISAEFDKEVKLSNYSDHGLTAVRVVALNDLEESEPSELWELESK